MNLKTAKLIVLFILLLGLASNGNSQHWIQQGSGASINEALDIATDNSGNSYTTGYISGSATFGGLPATTAGASDVFISKVNSTGVFQWVTTSGGSSTDRGNGIATDNQGNVYVTGFFNGSATFGSTTLLSSGSQDVFVAKYSGVNGSVQWAVRAGGAGGDIGNSIAIDNQGNVLVTGQFVGNAGFGATTLSSINGSIDVFVSKLNGATGAFVWTKQGSGKLEDRGLSISCDGGGNSYITGQFSDTITFDQTHNNTMQNAVFVLKLSATGSETWFRIIGGGGVNIAYDIVADNAGNAYVTGDFQGNLSFLGTPPQSLIGTENFKIFIAKYSSSGALTWKVKAGSSSDISSRAIDIDNSGNVYIVGTFECIFDEYSAQFGEATFNSVGQEDVFVAKYSSAGVWQNAQQLGNKSVVKASGIAVDNGGRPVVSGSFQGNLNFPTSDDFNATNLSLWANISCQPNLSYCGDPTYGQFHRIVSAGNFDIYVSNFFDQDREPYDYFLRSGGICNRNYPSPILENGLDSIVGCETNSGVLSFDSIFCVATGPAVTPPTTFATYPYIYSYATISTTSAYHIVTLDFASSCLPDLKDSIVVAQYPGGLPSMPTISDDVVINTNAVAPQPIYMCSPALATLTAGNVGTNTIEWFYDGQFIANTLSVAATLSGIYQIKVTDGNGCTRINSVVVAYYDPIPLVDLRMAMVDSVTYCENQVTPITYIVYDTLTSNPISPPNCLGEFIPNTNIPAYNVISVPVITPTPVSVLTNCMISGYFTPDTTGWYVFSADVTYQNFCDTFVYTVLDSVYVTILEAPPIDTLNFLITGPNFMCPGDTVTLVGSGDTSFVWFGPGVGGLMTDTIITSVAGTFTIGFNYSVTNSLGCTTTNSGLYEHDLTFITAPTISSDSTFLCPGDTATLVVTSASANGSNFNWQGPSGNLNINNDSVYVTNGGLYYCSIGDSNCYFESNTIEVIQYTTPDISAAGSPVLCSGDSVVLSVSSLNTSLINWYAPLSGNNPYQVVYTPGLYQCDVTSCGITSLASIQVIESTSTIDVEKLGILCTDSFADIMADSGFISYTWSHTATNSNIVSATDTGYYWVVAIDTDGCSVTDTTFIDLDQIFSDIETVNDNALCFGDSILISATTGLSTYKWLPNNETTQSIIVTSAGDYTLIATDSNGCRSVSDPTTIFTPDTLAKVSIDGNLSFCEGDSVVLTTTRRGKESYLWNPTQNDSNVIIVGESGTYIVSVIDTFGCLSKSKPISVYAQPFKLQRPSFTDTLICIGETAVFGTRVPGDVFWLDSNQNEIVEQGESFRTPTLFENTTYFVWSEDAFCQTDSARIHVTVQDCENLFVPNYLTPNGDGTNDLFKARLPEHTCFKMFIYNRWGMLVHLSEHINIGWDGKVIESGEPASEGTYYYLIEYCTHQEDNLIAKGSLTLIRE